MVWTIMAAEDESPISILNRYKKLFVPLIKKVVTVTCNYYGVNFPFT